MSLKKPYRRTVRQLTDGSYSNSGNGQYLLHKEYANDPQHYIRAYLIIQDDLKKLFEYVEPCDQNLKTISLKINELLVRVCIEIEANFTAILQENVYSKKDNMNIKNDYCKIEYTHNLSSYKVRFPIWKGKKIIRQPFSKWKNKRKKDCFSLKWYQIYNKAKHERYTFFPKATLDVLLDAVSGLIVLLTSQFMDETYSPTSKGLGIGESYSYNYDPSFTTAIGEYFTISYPRNWKEKEKYDFQWSNIKDDINPIDRINYNEIKTTF